MSSTVHRGDCLAVLKTLPAESIDSVVTDPPAGISFMGREWDSDKGGRDAWIAWLESVMREALRVLKPGGHALVWALPRTSHWTATAVENAGFEVRDVVTHHFGTGFPKSLDVSKAIDKAAGAEREVVGHSPQKRGTPIHGGGQSVGEFDAITAPATDAAKRWSGWGTALKPASEHWILARKPLVGTVASNVQRYGVGALNVDGCRVGDEVVTQHGRSKDDFGFASPEPAGRTWTGRWPANLVLSAPVDELLDAQSPGASRFFKVFKCEIVSNAELSSNPSDLTGNGSVRDLAPGSEAASDSTGRSALEPSTNGTPSASKPTSANSTPPTLSIDERFSLESPHESTSKRGPATSAAPNERIATTTTIHGPSTCAFCAARATSSITSPSAAPGVADSLFRYVAKPSKAEKEAGLDVFPSRQPGAMVGNARDETGRVAGDGVTPVAPVNARNFHPTVKPIELMRYLARLVTPPGGVVLDPFVGSGTTGCAAALEGFAFIGIEQSDEYAKIAEARIAHWAAKAPPAPSEAERFLAALRGDA